MLIGAAGLSAIVPSGPVSIISLVLAVVGGAGVIAGIIFGFLYLPKRIRPAWLTGRQPAGARTPRGGRPGGPGRR